MRAKGDRFKWAMVSLCAIALALSTVLTIHAFSGRGLIGCGAASNCGQVLGSRWSLLFGIIPVSGLALCTYSILLASLLLVDSKGTDGALRKLLRSIILAAAAAVLGSAVWFIIAQKTLIHAFCPYCMTTHTIGLLLAVSVIAHEIRSRDAGSRAHRLVCIAAGVCAAAVLAGVQLLTTPRTAYDDGVAVEELPLPDPHTLPVIGSPDAEHCIALLYDYRCAHCRRLHRMLPDLVAESGGRVAFVLCPTPLSRECNPYVPDGVDLFQGSCTLARTALALWRCDADAFRAYDLWLWGEGSTGQWKARTAGEAVSKAAELVGKARLEESLADEWIDTYLSKDFELFGRTSTDGVAALPRLVYGQRWLVPDADDAEGLASLVERLILSEQQSAKPRDTAGL